MREIKILAQEDTDGKILSMEPIKKATGRPGAIVMLTARIYTQDEIDRETIGLMQDNIHQYKRVNGAVHQIR